MQDNRDAGARPEAVQKGDSLPFFARFLEGQNSTGPNAGTMKYPSDWDEMDQTHKYPSDSDEGDVWHNYAG